MGFDDYYGYPPYVSVAEKKRKAEKLAQKMSSKGAQLEPVSLAGTKLTTTFWGKSWNQNLERYRDYENRLPRGRSYLRHGAVIDLKVRDGVIEAKVSGSSLYTVKITIKPLAKDRWDSLKKECSGKITSLIGLLQGKLPTPVMEAVTKQNTGLFPEPKDISFDCSCPDYAGLCKHCAAAVYGVGVRLDARPELLFLLRGVDHTELITGAGEAVAAQTGAGNDGDALDDLSGIFGIELETAPNPAPAASLPPPLPTSVPAKKTAIKAAKKAVSATKVAKKSVAKKAAKKKFKKAVSKSKKIW